ncbi:MAG: hypothetical protein HC845_05490 [Akkermansiaceae bacterium]|nr:hypothetical protein [Akkermansiaceae bacterium]
MKIHLPSILLAFGCVALASCYPFDESQNRKAQVDGKKDMKKVVEQTPEKTEAEMKAAKEKAAAKSKARAEAKKQQIAEQGDSPEISTTAPDPGKDDVTTTTPPVKEKRKEYPTATKAPGKEGFVLSPYNNKLVDVRGMAPGTLVQDPTHSGEGSGRFRVP